MRLEVLLELLHERMFQDLQRLNLIAEVFQCHKITVSDNLPF